MNSKVDQYLIEGCMRCELGGTPQCKVNDWQEELRELRRIILECGLIEELKWGAPCYTYKGKNILMLSALKESAIIGFFKGSLLEDNDHILIAPGENSQATRYFRIVHRDQIGPIENSIKAYIYEAIEIEKLGLKVQYKTIDEYEIPEELQAYFESDPRFKEAFDRLTPGRQKGYLLHFSQPKKSETRASRIERCLPKILRGKGFNER